MLNFTKILIAVLFILMAGTAVLSSSQGWWWYPMRNRTVMKEYQEENAAYTAARVTGFSQGTRIRKSSGATNRTFRSGTRGGRGK